MIKTNMFICKICGVAKTKKSLGIHIFNIHRIEMYDYAVKYFNILYTQPLCACGCQEKITTWSMQNGWGKYIHGHNKARLGCINSTEVKNRISETLKKKYATGEIKHPFKGLTKNNYKPLLEASLKLTGRCPTTEIRNKISGTLKDKYVKKEIKPWNSGLTKETDERILEISKNLLNSAVSLDTREKISKKIKFLYENTDIYTNPEYLERLQIARIKAVKKQIENGTLYAKTKIGRKRLSESMTQKNITGKMLISSYQTKPEKIVANWFPKELDFVGNGKVWLTFNHKHKNPDFIVKGKKKIVEVFGIYWHKKIKDDYNEVMDGYKSIGYDCFIIWDTEILKSPEEYKNKLKVFIES